MKTGFRGTFVISWSQTEVDGLKAASTSTLNVGATWSWHGEAVRVDGPNGLLRLDQADGEANLRRRAARTVMRLVGAVIQNTNEVDTVEVDEPLMDNNFVVTDGVQSYTVTVIDTGLGSAPLLMFLDEMPPRETDLWIVHHSLGQQCRTQGGAVEGGVICFTPGTRIATPDGPRLVEDLREGDMVQTRDNGAEPILWIGSRRMTGARLFVAPELRPIRFQAGALGIERPDEELLVSPAHQMLVRGAAAKALFNTSEVLVPARELVNGTNITVDCALREVTYVHLLLPSHQIVWANGVETESFHPANTAMSSLGEVDRMRLLAQFPDLEFDPHLYGGYARRNLSASESAILRYEAA